MGRPYSVDSACVATRRTGQLPPSDLAVDRSGHSTLLPSRFSVFSPSSPSRPSSRRRCHRPGSRFCSSPATGDRKGPPANQRRHPSPGKRDSGEKKKKGNDSGLGCETLTSREKTPTPQKSSLRANGHAGLLYRPNCPSRPSFPSFSTPASGPRPRTGRRAATSFGGATSFPRYAALRRLGGTSCSGFRAVRRTGSSLVSGRQAADVFFGRPTSPLARFAETRDSRPPCCRPDPLVSLPSTAARDPRRR